MHTLLRLRGPLQAWSNTAEPRAKSTWELPTKAGILGVIASAMGIQRGSLQEKAFLQKANTWKLTIFLGFPKTIEGKPVRGNAQIVLDYHTIGKPESPLPGATTRLHTGTPRTKAYLADADFVASLETNDADAQEMKTALENPNWPAFLGRKHCVPSTPIFITQATELPTAVKHGVEELHLGTGAKQVETERTNNTLEVADVPSTFAPSRKAYGHRFVTKM